MADHIAADAMSEQPKRKICRQCAEEYDNTPLNFPVYMKARKLCLKCVANRRRVNQERKREQRARVVAKTEEQILDTFCKAVKHKRGGSKIPHSAELLESSMQLIGGVDGLSALIVKQMLESKPGGAIRNKCLELLTRLVTTNTELEGSAKNLELWQEEELQAELDRKLKEAAEAYEIPEEMFSRESISAPKEGTS